MLLKVDRDVHLMRHTIAKNLALKGGEHHGKEESKEESRSKEEGGKKEEESVSFFFSEERSEMSQIVFLFLSFVIPGLTRNPEKSQT